MKALLAGSTTLILATLSARSGWAEPMPEVSEAATGEDDRTGLGFRLRGGALHSLDAGIDGGGEFDTTRAVIEGSVRYSFTETTFVGLSLGYNYDRYGFSSGAQIGGRDPWNQVHTLRVSTPIFVDFGERWSTLTIPILRLTAEEANDWGDGLTGGAIFGVSYRFSDRLRIGPGVGVLTELGDDVTVFPVIVVDWLITERLRLETGRALGATEGPGLVASYEFKPWLTASLGFRYEKLRFRLERNPAVSVAIGEDESFPVLAGLTIGYPYAQLTLIAGSKFGGKFHIEDANGRKLGETDYDPSFTSGATFQLYF